MLDQWKQKLSYFEQSGHSHLLYNERLIRLPVEIIERLKTKAAFHDILKCRLHIFC